MLLSYLIGSTYLIEYVYLLVAVLFSFLIAVLLYLVVVLITYKQYELEKVSAYECGFHPFEDARHKFNVKFYLVSILFIVFDLEITFLFPWAINLRNMDTLGITSMIIFLVVLTIGFVYEWLKGALDWQ
jgi:NADH-quinone oxidoreductase subunit A